ncbi:proteasomal ATPase-associated factor 1-like [Mytilus trossulus]|uniref:proteasomal ATPase-associated factor 1-like n=1 Tax=Mytilus trossulus TaxID=6551 RepID=UPI0030078732
MVSRSGRIILQADWNHVLKENGEKVWISFKTLNNPMIHGELCSDGVSSQGVPLVTGSESFNVQHVTKNTMTVKYKDGIGEYTRKFVAPQVEYSAIHNSRKSVTSLDVTPGGLGVSADSEGKLKVWETSNGIVRRDLQGHLGDVYTCKFFPSGVVILSGGADMQLKVWSAETGQCAANITGHKAAILDTVIIERGRNILSSSKDGTVKLWDVGQKSCLYTYEECGGNVNCCSIGIPNRNIDLGQSETITSEREVQTEGKLLLIGTEAGSIQGYGLQTRRKVFDLPCHGAVNCCCILSENAAVCGTQDGYITVLDLRNIRVPLKEWKETRSAILSFSTHNNGFFVSTGDGSCFFVNELCNTTTELTGADCDHIYKVVCDNTHVYTGCRDGQVRKYSCSQAGL